MLDKYFWFAQPSLILNSYDRAFFYTFCGMVALSILLLAAAYFSKHPVVKSMLKRFRNFFVSMGIIGLVWYGFRFENTPIFSKRMWAGAVFVAAIIWLVFILKDLFIKFPSDKSEYEANLLKSKYMPKSR